MMEGRGDGKTLPPRHLAKKGRSRPDRRKNLITHQREDPEAPNGVLRWRARSCGREKKGGGGESEQRDRQSL